MVYFDASALAKRYVQEPGSAKIARLLASDLAATSRLSAVEVTSALRRRVRERVLVVEDADRAVAALENDMRGMLVMELSSQVIRVAQDLLRQYPLRASDAIQLGSCLYLWREFGKEVVFAVTDDRLIVAARREGLTIA